MMVWCGAYPGIDGGEYTPILQMFYVMCWLVVVRIVG